jgi:hypothetical protein
MKFTSIITFVITILALTMRPVFSGTSDGPIYTSGFEINKFKILSSTNLLAKSYIKYLLFKNNNFVICTKNIRDQETCGELFEFDQAGQLYILSLNDRLANINFSDSYNVNLIKYKTNFITRVGQEVAKAISK